jgi:hypothetical protein
VNDERDGQSATQSPLSQDSFADKAVRFGCGSVLATLVFTFLVFSGLGEPLSVPVVVAGGIVLIVVSGILSVALGERYLGPLLKLIKWL